MESPKIYTITTLFINIDHGIFKHARTWGFYYDFEKAEEAVLNDYTGIWEGFTNNYAVIVIHGEGVGGLGDEVQWYHGNKYGQISRCEKPKQLEHVIGFGLG